MKRDLVRLSNNAYDLLIIGGGINGVCAAWDAASRGLSTALVEKGDFGHATSSATLKLIHGGLRYLQHLDLGRMRESVLERMTFMRIAPHLVHPLPFMIPTYKRFVEGKAFLSFGLSMYDLLTLDRNRLRDPQKRIPRHEMVTKSKCLEMEPHIHQDELTGGGIYFDCEMHDPNRLLLSFLLSASEAGAEVANYVEATGFVMKGSRVTGVKARDVLTDRDFEIQARVVVNASGPWSELVRRLLNGHKEDRTVTLSKGVQVITRPITHGRALAVASKHKDPRAVVSRGFRHFFVAPWRGHSAIGTADVIFNGDPDEFKITEQEILELIAVINESCPGTDLKREDVKLAFGGLRPIGKTSRKDQIYDHKAEGIEGLLTSTIVKYTEARAVAEELIDLVFMKLGRRPPRAVTAVTPLHGGQIEFFEDFLAQEIGKRPVGLGEDTVRHLVYHYGSEYDELLPYLVEDPANAEQVTGSSHVIKAEIAHGVREGMAQKLADVIFRRTELGTLGNPGEKCLSECAAIMAAELNWSGARTQRELEEVRSAFSYG